MPKTRKNKTKTKNNVVPFQAKKNTNIQEEKTLRQSEQDRLNSIIREKCNELMEAIDTSYIEKQWGLYALLFHAKQTAAYDLHVSEYVRVNEITSKEVIKNQREYLEENYSEFVKENKDTETNNKKVIH